MTQDLRLWPPQRGKTQRAGPPGLVTDLRWAWNESPRVPGRRGPSHLVVRTALASISFPPCASHWPRLGVLPAWSTWPKLSLALFRVTWPVPHMSTCGYFLQWGLALSLDRFAWWTGIIFSSLILYILTPLPLWGIKLCPPQCAPHSSPLPPSSILDHLTHHTSPSLPTSPPPSTGLWAGFVLVSLTGFMPGI